MIGIAQLKKTRQLPDGLELEVSEISGLNIVSYFGYEVRLLKTRVLDNKYVEFYDLHGNLYFVSPDAIKVSRDYWKGVEIDRDFYI